MTRATLDSQTGTSLTHAEVLLIVAGILVAMLLAALDQTIVVTAMPTTHPRPLSRSTGRGENNCCRSP